MLDIKTVDSTTTDAGKFMGHPFDATITRWPFSQNLLNQEETSSKGKNRVIFRIEQVKLGPQ